MFLIPVAVEICAGGGAAAASAIINGIGAIAIYNLPDIDTSDNAPAVDKPKKKSGRYVCNCRAQGLNCEGKRAYGFGTGIDVDFTKAFTKTKKMAGSNLPIGFIDIHHTSCKCTGPKGDPITPH